MYVYVCVRVCVYVVCVRMNNYVYVVCVFVLYHFIYNRFVLMSPILTRRLKVYTKTMELEKINIPQ